MKELNVLQFGSKQQQELEEKYIDKAFCYFKEWIRNETESDEFKSASKKLVTEIRDKGATTTLPELLCLAYYSGFRKGFSEDVNKWIENNSI